MRSTIATCSAACSMRRAGVRAGHGPGLPSGGPRGRLRRRGGRRIRDVPGPPSTPPGRGSCGGSASSPRGLMTNCRETCQVGPRDRGVSTPARSGEDPPPARRVHLGRNEPWSPGHRPLAGFASGTLDGSGLARVVAHLDVCAGCRDGQRIPSRRRLPEVCSPPTLAIRSSRTSRSGGAAFRPAAVRPGAPLSGPIAVAPARARRPAGRVSTPSAQGRGPGWGSSTRPGIAACDGWSP